MNDSEMPNGVLPRGNADLKKVDWSPFICTQVLSTLPFDSCLFLIYLLFPISLAYLLVYPSSLGGRS